MPKTVDSTFDPNAKKFLQLVTSNLQSKTSELMQVELAASVGSKRDSDFIYWTNVSVPPNSLRQLFTDSGGRTSGVPPLAPVVSSGDAQKEAAAYTSETMTSPTRDEISLQFQNARLQVDKDLLAAKQAEAEFRAEIKVMIAQQGETFQTLRSDINKAVGEANLNVERLRSEMHKESSVNLRWIVSTMIAIGLATAGAVSWVVKSSLDGRSAPTAAAVVSQPVATGTATTGTPPQSAPAATK